MPSVDLCSKALMSSLRVTRTMYVTLARCIFGIAQRAMGNFQREQVSEFKTSVSSVNGVKYLLNTSIRKQ